MSGVETWVELLCSRHSKSDGGPRENTRERKESRKDKEIRKANRCQLERSVSSSSCALWALFGLYLDITRFLLSLLDHVIQVKPSETPYYSRVVVATEIKAH